MNQCVFNFFAVIGQGRRNVERLCRFNPDRFGSAGAFIEGKLHRVDYESWLRWYTPLCDKGSQ